MSLLISALLAIFIITPRKICLFIAQTEAHLCGFYPFNPFVSGIVAQRVAFPSHF